MDLAMIILLVSITPPLSAMTYRYDVLHDATASMIGCTSHVIENTTPLAECGILCSTRSACLAFSWSADVEHPCSHCLVQDVTTWRVGGSGGNSRQTWYLCRDEKMLRGKS